VARQGPLSWLDFYLYVKRKMAERKGGAFALLDLWPLALAQFSIFTSRRHTIACTASSVLSTESIRMVLLL